MPLTAKAFAGVATAALAVVVLLPTGATMFLSAAVSACATPARSAAPSRYDPEQAAHAAVISAVGAELGVPVRGRIVAVATAIQESSLRNVAHGDAAGPDSRGLFQQRADWGPLADRMNPAEAARMFYTGGRRGQPGLLDIPGWETMPLAQAAQAVQRSRTPDAFAQHERDAAILVSGSPDEACHATAALPAGPTGRMLRAALAQVGDPYVYAATGPDAFDCSGLVVYAWAQAGYRLTVRTAEQMRQVAAPVAPGQEQPGDLVFSQFNTPRVPGGAGHVAIVVRPGVLIEAPRSGLNVRVRMYRAGDGSLRFGRLPAQALRPLRSSRS